MVQFAHQRQQLGLLLGRERAHELTDQRLMRWHNLMPKYLPRLREKEAIGPSLLAALQQAARLHAVQQLADVALRHKQAIRKLLLGDTLACANLREYVELGEREIPGPHLFYGGMINLVKDTREAQPGGYRAPLLVHCSLLTHCCHI